MEVDLENILQSNRVCLSLLFYLHKARNCFKTKKGQKAGLEAKEIKIQFYFFN